MLERKNGLSDNLKAYQKERGKTLSEFSKELGIARSTLQSIMLDGNTSLDTVIRMANSMGMTLDELVFGRTESARLEPIQCILQGVGWYKEMPAEKQDKIRYHINEIIKVINA